MQKMENLQPDRYYHIYNCGINGENLFKETINYTYFLKLYNRHIMPYVDTFAWCLLPNHFHLLVKIIDMTGKGDDPTGFKNLSGLTTQKPIHQRFSNLFNAYSKSINKIYNRHGSLFERPFKRKLIDNETYLTTLVTYIHNNPVHHGFTRHASQWPWSSYQTCLNNKATKLKRSQVLTWFNDVANFKYVHEQHAQNIRINEKLKLE